MVAGNAERRAQGVAPGWRAQLGLLAGLVQARRQDGEAFRTKSPMAAIARRRGVGQRDDVGRRIGTKAFPFQALPRPIARQRALPPVSRPLCDRRIGAIEHIEPGELVEADDAIELTGRRRSEFPGEGPVVAMVGSRMNRQQLDRNVCRVAPAVLRREDRDLVAAARHDERQTDAIALQPAFRKQSNDAECHAQKSASRSNRSFLAPPRAVGDKMTKKRPGQKARS